MRRRRKTCTRGSRTGRRGNRNPLWRGSGRCTLERRGFKREDKLKEELGSHSLIRGGPRCRVDGSCDTLVIPAFPSYTRTVVRVEMGPVNAGMPAVNVYAGIAEKGKGEAGSEGYL